MPTSSGRFEWPFANVCSDGHVDRTPSARLRQLREGARPVRARSKLFTVEEAVRKMTSLAAANVGVADRGRIAPGYFADLVLFDPGVRRPIERTFGHGAGAGRSAFRTSG